MKRTNPLKFYPYLSKMKSAGGLATRAYRQCYRVGFDPVLYIIPLAALAYSYHEVGL